MQDFSDFTKMIDEMMADFGVAGVLTTQLESGDYNTQTGSNTVITGDIPIVGIFMDLTLQSNGQGTRAGGLIQDGDKVVYVRPSNELLPILMPDGVLAFDSSDDRVTFGGVKYKVVTSKVIDPTASGVKPILYELYVRR